MKNDVLAETIKVSPPVGVTGALVFGVPVDTLAILLTVIYTVLSLFALIRDKYWNHYRDKEDDDE